MIAAAVLVLAALALTYVRTTWIAFALAAITLAALARTVMARVLVVTCAALVTGALAVGGATPTTAAFAQRLETFGALNSDTSANARQQSFFSRLPDAASRPLGHGLGSAGEATKLGADSDLRAPDNGYLSLLYQLGPAGFILFMAAVGVALTPMLKAVLMRGARDRESTLLLAIAVFVLVQLAGGDLFYGVTGAMVWYLLGRSVTVARRI
jgi:O-antigen ligase